MANTSLKCALPFLLLPPPFPRALPTLLPHACLCSWGKLSLAFLLLLHSEWNLTPTPAIPENVFVACPIVLGASGSQWTQSCPPFGCPSLEEQILRWADKLRGSLRCSACWAHLWPLALIRASKASALEGVLSRRLVNRTDEGGRADKSWGEKGVENQGISRFRTQRRRQALQMPPPLQPSAVCLGPGPSLCALTESHIHGFRAGWKPSAGGLAIPVRGLTGGRDMRWWWHGGHQAVFH